MNRRSFLANISSAVACFTILPGAGRIWRAEHKLYWLNGFGISIHPRFGEDRISEFYREIAIRRGIKPSTSWDGVMHFGVYDFGMRGSLLITDYRHEIRQDFSRGSRIGGDAG